jgi:tetratricopeptide (TPR) repeat protein/ribosomal protein S27AE
MRPILAAVVALSFAAGVAAEDGVRLRNGKYVSGTVSLKEEDKEGFEIQKWDGSGAIYVLWSQIPEAEKARLLGKPAGAASTAAAANLLDGIRVITSNREVVGLLVKEEAGQVLIKVKDQKLPIPIPAAAILRKDNVRLPETEVYSFEEMLDNRAQKADLTSADALLELADFAAAVKLYERAEEFLVKAAAADPARKDYWDKRIAANKILVKEGKAAAAILAIRKLCEEMEFAKALEEAKKFQAEFADTETGKSAKELIAGIEESAKQFETRKAEVLKDKVPELWKIRRSSYLSQFSGGKHKLAEARTADQKLDAEVSAELAKKFKVTPEEIAKAWELREAKNRTVSYGSGTWIVKGGQDGGLDTTEKYTPQQRQQQNPNVNDPFGAFNSVRRRQPQQQKPVDLGKKMQSSEEWWQSVSSTDRKNWLEADYAATSTNVKKVREDTRKCPECNGEGSLRANRMGQNVDVKCQRCHGVQTDLIIVYY